MGTKEGEREGERVGQCGFVFIHSAGDGLRSRGCLAWPSDAHSPRDPDLRTTLANVHVVRD